MTRRILAGALAVCIGLCGAASACADGLGDFFGGVLEDISTIAGGLTGADTVIPKEIHYGDFERFQQDVDAIERFFQEYAEFMKSYDEKDLSMLVDYTAMMASYAEAMQVLEALDETKMTAKETMYYTELMVRINKHLDSVLDEL